ncbi:hypothetical protein ACP70R_004846 [Stipagrostis hirtigluma subsp. patula]
MELVKPQSPHPPPRPPPPSEHHRGQLPHPSSCKGMELVKPQSSLPHSHSGFSQSSHLKPRFIIPLSPRLEEHREMLRRPSGFRGWREGGLERIERNQGDNPVVSLRLFSISVKIPLA